MNSRSRYQVFIVHHTHWDREWYEPAHRFRQRLTAVVDELLHLLESDPRFGPFLLDGQLAILADYLDVKPMNRERVSRLARAGRLLLGPWYVLADELLCTDEVLVRNLSYGRAAGRTIGGWLPVGYSPDAFGHPAALPTILNGFGIEHAIVWRGYGGEPGQEGDLFRWRASDGSVVLTHHLPPDGYEFGSRLANDGELAEKWKTIRDVLESRSTTQSLLVLSGADHHGPQADIDASVERLNTLDSSCQFRMASPIAYFESLPADLAVAEVEGEQRFSYRYAWTLQGVHSTRSRLKRTMAEAERLLVRWAEPQCALAAVHDGADRHADLALAWREHLLSCAHDSFGGCCTDEVARDVTHRAEGVVSAARHIYVDSVLERLGVEASVARRSRDDWTPRLAVINPTPAARSGVVEATVAYFVEDVPVGMTSARSSQGPSGSNGPKAASPQPVIRDADGRALPLQVLGRYLGYDRLDSPYDYPDQDLVHAVRVALHVDRVPGLGLLALSVDEGEAADPAHDDPVLADRDALESSWCTVSGDSLRAFRVDAPDFGWMLRGVAQVDSERDEGDTYTFQPVAGDRRRRARWKKPRIVWEGPLVACLARDFVVPDRAEGTVFVKLVAGSRVARVVVEGRNQAPNHRLRISFPSTAGRGADISIADMHYGPVVRARQSYDPLEFPIEWPVKTAPMHRYVTVPGSGGSGLTVFSRGAFEYELTPRGRVAVTILRAVGDLSRGMLDARPGHAGWPSLTPAAQEIGDFRLELGITPLTAHVDDAPAAWSALERCAEEFHAPLAGLMIRHAIDMPDEIPGVVLEGDGLVFKSLRRSVDGDALVLRCVNATNRQVRGSWRWRDQVRSAVLANLAEEPDETRRLTVRGNQMSFEAAPREVVTVLLRP